MKTFLPYVHLCSYHEEFISMFLNLVTSMFISYLLDRTTQKNEEFSLIINKYVHKPRQQKNALYSFNQQKKLGVFLEFSKSTHENKQMLQDQTNSKRKHHWPAIFWCQINSSDICYNINTTKQIIIQITNISG